MADDKKITAVEWIERQIKSRPSRPPFVVISWIDFEELIFLAKQVESKQIVNAWKEDRDMFFFGDKGGDLSKEDINKLANQYYQETYGN